MKNKSNSLTLEKDENKHKRLIDRLQFLSSDLNCFNLSENNKHIFEISSKVMSLNVTFSGFNSYKGILQTTV